ncbi:MAG: calcineurin-like phosphoesterase family protein [Pseudomonadota bacterium]
MVTEQGSRASRSLFFSITSKGVGLAALALVSCTSITDEADPVATTPSSTTPQVSAAIEEKAQETAAAPTARLFTDYRGAPEIIRGAPGSPARETVEGTVFEDTNQNSRRDVEEVGLAGVMVSNGRDVAVTDTRGAYSLRARDDMAVFVVQPSGYQVPHNGDWVPQIAYQHKPEGSPKAFRYGGLPATGPLPQAINFPLIRAGRGERFRCAIIGDSQTYSNQEIGYLRDSLVDDLLRLHPGQTPDCLLAVGDVVGDDLGLIPRMADVLSLVQSPQWWAHGNHDLDFDADFDRDSADSWRNLYGPADYAFEIGDALFIVLDNVVYPCTEEDAETSGRAFCAEGTAKRYNGRLRQDQLDFVENLLAQTPRDRTIVIAHHIPFVSFVDQDAPPHQTDNANALYALLEGRNALSLSGHTHTTENLSPGDQFAGWEDTVGVRALPFRHIIAGAASGAWFNGDFDIFGVPMSLQRLGAPRGWLDLAFEGPNYVETYHGTNLPEGQSMWLSVNTPAFRDWYNAIADWGYTPREARDPLPPFSIMDLPDTKILTPDDLAGGSYLTVNAWDGTSESQVEAQMAGRVFSLERTQSATGEEARVGAEWADPFAAQRQLSVARWAFQSRSGDPRNQGWEAFKGSSFGPDVPQPQFSVADRSVHLWRVRLPEDLPIGAHAVTVTVTDRHGRVRTDSMVIEVREQQPQARFRSSVHNAVQDGAVVRPSE